MKNLSGRLLKIEQATHINAPLLRIIILEPGDPDPTRDWDDSERVYIFDLRGGDKGDKPKRCRKLLRASANSRQ